MDIEAYRTGEPNATVTSTANDASGSELSLTAIKSTYGTPSWNWGEAHFYKVKVTVAWKPGIYSRTNDAKATITTPISLEAFYYPGAQ